MHLASGWGGNHQSNTHRRQQWCDSQCSHRVLGVFSKRRPWTDGHGRLAARCQSFCGKTRRHFRYLCSVTKCCTFDNNRNDSWCSCALSLIWELSVCLRKCPIRKEIYRTLQFSTSSWLSATEISFLFGINSRRITHSQLLTALHEKGFIIHFRLKNITSSILQNVFNYSKCSYPHSVCQDDTKLFT